MIPTSGTENFGLKLVNDNIASGGTAAPIKLATYQTTQETDESRLAEKLVASSFQNVAFLNDHLKKYDREIDFPALGQNVLYLAYTIEVKPEARFEADQLRDFLETRGIETKADFRFHATPVGSQNNRVESTQSKVKQELTTPNRFCIGSHLDLRIVDLVHIVRSFERFFEQIEAQGTTCG